jgi:very-short-patch-repair endonuclease
MTKHYNKTSEKEKRRTLRKNQTHAEKVLWSQLRNRQLLGVKFRRQYSVDHFVIDFYAPELKLAIESDGSIHELEEQKDYDKARQEYLESFSITFVRITNNELFSNPNKAFERIEETIKSLQERK